MSQLRCFKDILMYFSTKISQRCCLGMLQRSFIFVVTISKGKKSHFVAKPLGMLFIGERFIFYQ